MGFRFCCFSSSVMNTDALVLWWGFRSTFASTFTVTPPSTSFEVWLSSRSSLAAISSSSPSYGTVEAAKRLGNSSSSSCRDSSLVSSSSSEASSNCPPLSLNDFPLANGTTAAATTTGVVEFVVVGIKEAAAAATAAVGLTRVAHDFVWMFVVVVVALLAFRFNRISLSFAVSSTVPSSFSAFVLLLILSSSYSSSSLSSTSS